jgi:hypothetical protein
MSYELPPEILRALNVIKVELEANDTPNAHEIVETVRESLETAIRNRAKEQLRVDILDFLSYLVIVSVALTVLFGIYSLLDKALSSTPQPVGLLIASILGLAAGAAVTATVYIRSRH